MDLAMNPKQNQRECIACRKSKSSFILTVREKGVSRQLCVDCLLKEHQELFCPICLNIFDTSPPQGRTKCLNCPSIIHLSCSPRPPCSSAASSSSAPPPSSLICPPCSVPNFSFFPKSSRDNVDVPEMPLDREDLAKALNTAAKISGESMFKAVKHFKRVVVHKVVAARAAKMKAKDALENLQLLVLRQKNASEKNTPNSNKRKMDDRGF